MPREANYRTLPISGLFVVNLFLLTRRQGSTGVANLYGRTLSSAPIRGGRSGGLTGGLTPVGKGAHAAEAWAAREAAREGSSYACALDDSREKSSHDRPVRRAFTTARQLQAVSVAPGTVTRTMVLLAREIDAESVFLRNV